MADYEFFALIVEDTIEIADIMQITLRRAGIDSFHAADGYKALEFLAENTPDIVLLDIGLPGISGWDVLEAIKEQHPDDSYPVIVLTAFNDPANRLIGKFQKQVYEYVTKPFEMADVQKIVKAALGIE